MNNITILYAFLSTMGFAVVFNIPRKAILYSSIAGAMGWGTYICISAAIKSPIFASFAGAFIVGIMGEFFARLKKKPATIFVVPGIIPLVPGYGLYYAMHKILERDYNEAMSVGFEAILIAISIASAVIMTTSIGRMIKRHIGLKNAAS